MGCAARPVWVAFERVIYMNDFVTRWLKLSLVALVGCGFIAMLVYALFMKDEIRSAQVEPPLVAAPDEPAKRRPEEPGGMTIPNQDKMVFDLLEHPSPTDFTSSEPRVSADTVASGSVAQVSPDAASAAPVTAPAAAPAVAQAPVEEVQVAPPEQIKPVAGQKVVQPVAEAPVEKPAPAKQAEMKKVEAPKSAATAAKGDWGVQLAAVGSKDDADKAVANFSKMPALKGMRPHVASATVNGKGVYRVQFVGAATRPAAASICAKMGKQPCLPVEVK